MKRPTARSATRSVTPTSHVPSEEEERSISRDRKENKKHESPKKKKKRRRQKALTLSDEPSMQSPRTKGPTPIEVEGGTGLKVGVPGAGNLRVTIERISKK